MKRGITALLLVLGAAALLFLLERPDDVEPPSLLPPSAPAPPSPRAPALGPDGTWTLTGRVRTLEGEPVPSVRVRVARVTPPESAGWARDLLDSIRKARREAREPWATTTTRADGTFAVPGLSPTHDHEVRAVSSSDRTIGSCAYVDAGERPHLELRVLRATWLFGQVVDSNGRGTPALLSLRIARRTTHWGTSDVRWWSDGERATGEDGRFRLRVPAGALHLDARRRGDRGVSLRHLHAHATFFVRIPLEDGAGATIAGRVTDEAGEAVAGAEVVMTADVTPEPVDRMFAVAVTDADGRYALRHFPPGEANAPVVLAPDTAPGGGVHADLALHRGETRRADVRLLGGGSVEGTVRDPAGRPVAEATVLVLSRAEGRWRRLLGQARTDAAGRYRIDHVALGPAQVQAQAPGFYLPSTAPHAGIGTYADTAGRGVRTHVSRSGEVLEADVVLGPGTPLGGTVAGPDGAPVAGALVVAWRALERWRLVREGPLPRAITDAEGHYVFTDLEPATDWVLQATAGPLISPLRTDVLVESEGLGRRNVWLHLAPPASLAGRVVDGDGDPVRRLPIEIRDHREGGATDDEGRFAFDGLGPGTYRLDVGPRFEASDPVSFSHPVRAGQARERVELVFPNTLEIAGRVVDEEGRPAPDVRLFVERIDEVGSSSERTDEVGRFRFRWLAPGAYRLEMDRVQQPDPIEAGTTDLRLVRPTGQEAVIEGAVLAPDGSPVVGAKVTVRVGRTLHGGSLRIGRVHDGRFRLAIRRGIGAVEVEIEDARDTADVLLDVRPFRQTFPAFPDAPLKLPMEPGLSVSGRLVDAAGAGVRGAHVQVVSAEGGERRERYLRHLGAVTDAGGRFAIPGLGEGQAVLSVDAGEARSPPDVLRVQPGTPVTVTLQAAAMLVGRVLSDAGDPVAGAFLFAAPVGAPVDVEDLPRSRPQAISGSDGRFRIPGLAPVPTVVMVRAPSGKAYWRWRHVDVQQVVQPGAQPVELRVQQGVRIRAKVLRPDGRPARECFVLGHRVTAAGESRDPRWADPDFTTYRGSTHGFLSSLVPPGTYALRAWTQEAYGEAERIEVTVPRDVVRLRLTEARLVRGRLLGEDLQGFDVDWVVAEPRELADDETDAAGRFGIKAKSDAEGLLYAHRDGDPRCALLRGARAGEGPYELLLQPGRRIEGRLEGLPADNTGRAYVMVKSPLGFLRSERLSGQGAFSVLGLPPGTYELRFYGGRLKGHFVSGSRTVKAGGEPLRFEVHPR